MSVHFVECSNFIAKRLGSIDPSKFPNEEFELYSIPSYDNGIPEYVKGSEIGSTKQIVQPGDVLLSKIVPHIKRCWLVGSSKGKRIIASGEWIVFRTNEIDGNYLKHVLVGVRFHKEFMSTVSGVGGSLLRARPAFVGKIKIPVPSKAEQLKIAAVLDEAENLQQKRRQAIEKINSLSQAIFLEMFGDPVNNEKGWLTLKLNGLTKKIGSGSTPKGGDASYKESGISLIRSLNVHDKEFKFKDLAFIDDEQANKLKNVTVEANDVLLNITGASVARVCIVPNQVLPARVNQHVSIIRPNEKLNSLFLESLFVCLPFKNHLLRIGGAGATREALTKEQLENLDIIVPDIKIQSHFVKRVEALNKLLDLNQTQGLKIEEMFGSLQDKYFIESEQKR